MKKTYVIAALCAGSALVAACSKHAPSGQVAAIVNGKEVTLQEINTELQSANVPASADKQQVQRALLQQVIDRKLLVEAAEDKGVDKTPEYLAQKRRAEELMLAQAYANKQLAAVPVPGPGDIDRFMADHPNVFTARERLSIDQIRFPRPQNVRVLSTLQNVHSLDAAGEALTKLGIKYERSQSTIDSGTIPTNIMQQINKLPAGEPFVVPSAQGVTVNVVTGRQPIAVNMAQARPAATQAWRQEKFGAILKSQLDTLKANAKITYQNGFGPPAPQSSGAPAPGTAPAPAPASAPAGS